MTVETLSGWRSPRRLGFRVLAVANFHFPASALRISAVSANLRSVGDPVKYITDDRGERTAVVLPIADYEKLLEDLEDLAVVAERREEPTIPHEQLVSELKRDGLL
jgi:hypothetical protein